MAEPARAVSQPSSPTPRRSRDELRELLVSAGVELLVDEGLGTGAGHLTFKRVFEWLEQHAGIRVTNASVIGRIWNNQSEYQTEVLVAIASNDGTEMLESAYQTLRPSLAGFDRTTVEGRWQSLAELARVGGAAHLELLSRSTRWQRWVGVWALVMAGHGQVGDDDPVAEALRQGYENVSRRLETGYAQMLSSFGFRLREPLTLRQLTVATGALAEGCALRSSVDPASTQRILRPTGPGRADQEWTLFSVGVEALLRVFVEIDPEWVPTEPASPRHRGSGPGGWAT